VTSGSEVPARLSKVGIDGPKMSVSRMPVRRLWREKAKARLTASVDLPTPPLALETAMTWSTWAMRRLGGRPRGAPRRVGAGPAGGALRGKPSGFSWLSRRADVVKHLRIADDTAMYACRYRSDRVLLAWSFRYGILCRLDLPTAKMATCGEHFSMPARN